MGSRGEEKDFVRTVRISGPFEGVAGRSVRADIFRRESLGLKKRGEGNGRWTMS